MPGFTFCPLFFVGCDRDDLSDRTDRRFGPAGSNTVTLGQIGLEQLRVQGRMLATRGIQDVGFTGLRIVSVLGMADHHHRGCALPWIDLGGGEGTRRVVWRSWTWCLRWTRAPTTRPRGRWRARRPLHRPIRSRVDAPRIPPFSAESTVRRRTGAGNAGDVIVLSRLIGEGLGTPSAESGGFGQTCHRRSCVRDGRLSGLHLEDFAAECEQAEEE